MSAPVKDKTIFGMSLGAEPKRVAFLGVLLAIFAALWFFTRDSTDGPSAPSSSPSSAAKIPPAPKGVAEPESAAGRAAALAARRESGSPGGPRRQGSRQALSAAVKEFHATLKPDRDNPVDPSKTDPTIRFASLAKVQAVGMAGGGRSLFDFGAVTLVAEGPKPGSVKITPSVPIYGPAKLEPIPPAPPPPPPPAIPLKFYGFVNNSRSGERRAFFMENDDIYIASEGEIMKSRYKLVKIGVNSVVLEDTQVKNNQQTIKLTDEAQSTN